MLGRKTFTTDEIEGAKGWLKGLRAADLDPELGNTVLLAFDRRFVHRVRPVTGKDGTPLNELEMYVEALLDHDGVLTANKVLKLDPGSSVLGIEFGERVQVTAEQAFALADASLAELEAKYSED